MALFQYQQNQQYVCYICKKQCQKYYLFTNLTIEAVHYKTILNITDLLKSQQTYLQFYCVNCYNKKLLYLPIVSETVKQRRQENAEQIKQISDMVSFIESAKQQQKCMFQFHDIHKQFKYLEKQISKFMHFLENDIIQTKSQKLLETFNQQNIDGFKEYQNNMKMNWNQTQIKLQKIWGKIEQMRSHLQQIFYGEKNSLQMTSKLKIQNCIDEEIKNLNLEMKREILQEIQQLKIQQDKQPQILQAASVTNQ